MWYSILQAIGAAGLKPIVIELKPIEGVVSLYGSNNYCSSYSCWPPFFFSLPLPDSKTASKALMVWELTLMACEVLLRKLEQRRPLFEETNGHTIRKRLISCEAEQLS